MDSPVYLLWLCRPPAPSLRCTGFPWRLLFCRHIYVDPEFTMCLPRSKQSPTHRRPKGMIETRYVAVFDPESCSLCRLPASKIDGELDPIRFGAHEIILTFQSEQLRSDTSPSAEKPVRSLCLQGFREASGERRRSKVRRDISVYR